MIVPDTSLLIHAYDTTSPSHGRAREWWEESLSGLEPVGIPWVVVLAFVRLMTHPTLSDNPMPVAQSQEIVTSWFDLGNARLLSPSPATLPMFFSILDAAGTGGNLTTDAMIAALALEYGGCVYTNDSDFGRFPDLLWRNPLRAS